MRYDGDIPANIQEFLEKMDGNIGSVHTTSPEDKYVAVICSLSAEDSDTLSGYSFSGGSAPKLYQRYHLLEEAIRRDGSILKMICVTEQQT